MYSQFTVSSKSLLFDFIVVGLVHMQEYLPLEFRDTFPNERLLVFPKFTPFKYHMFIQAGVQLTQIHDTLRGLCSRIV